MTLIPRITHRQMLRNLRVLTAVFAVLLVLSASGLMAQPHLSSVPSQEFLNGQFTEEFKTIERRLSNVEDKFDRVFYALAGIAGTGLYQVWLHYRREKTTDAKE